MRSEAGTTVGGLLYNGVTVGSITRVSSINEVQFPKSHLLMERRWGRGRIGKGIFFYYCTDLITPFKLRLYCLVKSICKTFPKLGMESYAKCDNYEMHTGNKLSRHQIICVRI